MSASGVPSRMVSTRVGGLHLCMCVVVCICEGVFVHAWLCAFL